MRGIDPRSDPPAIWRQDVSEIIATLVKEMEREERRGRGVSVEEVAAVLALDDALRAVGIEVLHETFHQLTELAISTGLGGETHG